MEIPQQCPQCGKPPTGYSVVMSKCKWRIVGGKKRITKNDGSVTQENLKTCEGIPTISQLPLDHKHLIGWQHVPKNTQFEQKKDQSWCYYGLLVEVQESELDNTIDGNTDELFGIMIKIGKFLLLAAAGGLIALGVGLLFVLL